MTEDEARAWLDARVPRETIERLEELISLILDEAGRQNLISASSADEIWTRHIVDSAQLIGSAPPTGTWIDLGSGAGFPGLVVAIIGTHQVVLAESRARRVAFLNAAIDRLGLGDRVAVRAGRIETFEHEPFDIISARAFAPLDRLLPSAIHLSSPATRWLLPKGRSAKAELDAVRGSWQGSFRVVPSVTDPEAAIIVAERVAASRDVRKAGSKR